MICVSSCVHTPLISASQETYSYNTNNIRISSKLTIFLADSLDVIHCKQMCAQNINVTGQKSNFYLNVAIDRVIYVSLCYILDFCSFFFLLHHSGYFSFFFFLARKHWPVIVKQKFTYTTFTGEYLCSFFYVGNEISFTYHNMVLYV